MVEIAVAGVAAVPATLAAWAAVIAAQRSGSNGIAVKELRALREELQEHIHDTNLHVRGANA